MVAEDTAFDRADVCEAVAAFDASWRVESVTPAEDGHLPVFHVSVAGEGAPGDCVLKAAPDDGDHAIATEAALLVAIGDLTGIPVPTVYGYAAGDAARAECLLMAEAAGTRIPSKNLVGLTDSTVERLAADAGRYLAALHRLDVVDAFGKVDVDYSDRSTSSASALANAATVSGLQGSTPRDDWPSVLGSWLETTCSYLDETEFAALEPDIERGLAAGLSDLSGPFEAAVGRIDHGLHNLLVDPQTGSTATVLDWGFTLAVPPAYDLACVEANLALGPWAVHPATPDRETAIREALRDAYATHGDPDVLERLRDHHDVYELACLVRAALHLPETMADAPPEVRAESATAYRARIRDAVDRIEQ